MKLYIKSLFYFLALSFFLTGCAGVYKYDFSEQKFNLQTIKDQNDTNFVVFTDFDIPQNQGRSMRTSDVIQVNVYDVTEGNKFVGRMHVNGFIGGKNIFDRGSFIEYEGSLGHHVFMLVYANTSLITKDSVEYHIDFIETEIRKENRTYISISLQYKGLSSHMMKSFLYGGGLQPFFTLVDMKDKDFDFCSNIQWDKQEIVQKNIEDYMQNNSINLNQKYFKNYCGMLANPHKTRMIINPDRYDDFNKSHQNIQLLKDENFPIWKQFIKRNPIFPLIQPSLNRTNQ